MSTTTTDELKELIRGTLVEPPGQLSKELIKLCEGLITIEPDSKNVRVISEKVTEKEKIALFCLGRWILSYLLDSPSLSEVDCETLAKQLAIDAKAVSAYASLLIKKDRLLSPNARGTYQALLARIPDFLKRLQKKAGHTNSVDQGDIK